MVRNDVIASITFDRSNPLPLYYQLIDGIRNAIASGELKPGDKLPPIHQLAAENNLAVVTISRAFAELAREGLIVSRRGMGTFIAQISRKSTEIIIYFPFEVLPPHKQSFFYQIVKGLREGYNEPERRFVFSHLDNWAPPPHELLEVARIRNVDGIVIYRPAPGLANTIRMVSPYVPTVTLFSPAENSCSDAIMANPCPALIDILTRYRDKGARKFSYLGGSSHIQSDYQSLPYTQLYEEYLRFSKEAGVESSVFIEPNIENSSWDKLARKAPKDSVVLAATPDIAEAAARAGRYSGIITYTEFFESLEMIKNKADVIYMGIENAARKAVNALEERRANLSREQRIIEVQPAVYSGGSLYKESN